MRWIDFEDSEAEKERLEKKIKENPDDAQAYYELGTVYEYLRAWTTSKEFCDKALKIDPKNVMYHAFHSFVNTHLEEHEEAIYDLITVIELGGDESDYYVDMAQGAQRGQDKEYAVLMVVDLRKEGRDKIADKLEEWLLKPYLAKKGS